MPLDLPVSVKLQHVTALGKLIGKGRGDVARHGRAVDYQTGFGVERGRTWVQVERADKDALAVDGEGLGMQAGP